MSRHCPCRDFSDGTRRPSRQCLHLVPNTRGLLLDAGKMVDLAPLLGPLVDAADAFDGDGLMIDSECAVHGAKPVSDSECSCEGERYSAVEFAQWLAREVRIAGQRDRAGMKHDHEKAGARRRWTEALVS